jgi:general secretion pathway protein G
VSERYLRAIPRDPITASIDTWQTEQAERDAGAVASQAGIINVKSGAPDTALDGSRYGEW